MFGKVIHKSSQRILPNTSDTVENCHKYRFDNHRNTYIESLNLNRHKSGNTGEEPCKYNNYVSSFNLCSMISQHQRIHTGRKEHKNMEYGFEHKLKLKQTNCGRKSHQWRKCGKCFKMVSNLSRHQRSHST